MSPRMTVWNQTLESSPISTSPITLAPPATNTLPWHFGAMPRTPMNKDPPPRPPKKTEGCSFRHNFLRIPHFPRRLVYRLVNSLTHRERRCAAPARRATEDGGGHSWVIRRENQECPPCCKKRNEAGARGLSPEGGGGEGKRRRRQTAKD